LLGLGILSNFNGVLVEPGGRAHQIGRLCLGLGDLQEGELSVGGHVGGEE